MKVKFILCSLLMFFVVATITQAQTETDKKKMPKSRSERIEQDKQKAEKQNNGAKRERADRTFPSEQMIKDYALTEAQVAKIKKISEDYGKKMKTLRDVNAKKEGDKPENTRPSEEDMKKIKTLMDEQNKAIRAELTKEQQEKWDKAQKEREERRKNMRNGEGRQRPGGAPRGEVPARGRGERPQMRN